MDTWEPMLGEGFRVRARSGVENYMEAVMAGRGTSCL